MTAISWPWALTGGAKENLILVFHSFSWPVRSFTREANEERQEVEAGVEEESASDIKNLRFLLDI